MSHIKRLKNKHAGETGVIIGNGASLKDIDLKRLAKKYPTLGSNKIYLYPFTPDYWAVADNEMLYSCLADGYPNKDFSPKVSFVNSMYPLEWATPVNYTIRYDFSRDIAKEIVIGGTVTYVLLQIAYYMGFKKILLVGVDHNYPGADNGTPGSKFVQAGEDEDHFHPEYFKAGMIYNRPELKATEKMYLFAKNVYEADGRKILNLTTNTRLFVYDRVNVKNYY